MRWPFRIRKTILLAVGIIIFFGYNFLSVPNVKAIPVAVVADAPHTISEIKNTIKTTFLEALLKAGKISFLNSLRSLVNKFAYDTATYLGSGGEGQKPVYYTQEFLPWLRDQAFNVGGQFIEDFSNGIYEDENGQVKYGGYDNGEFIKKYGICAPNLAVSVKIALGLTDFANQSKGLSQSRCNLKKIYENGRDQIELYRDPDYLKNLAVTAFDPTTTDVGAAFTLFDQIGYKISQEEEGIKLQRLEDGGWIPAVDKIAQSRRAPPGQQERLLEQTQDIQTQNFFTQTGDIFVDAANIFLNQLALSAFNKLIDGLSGRRSSLNSGATSSYYQQGSTGGITEIERRNSSILQARFNERTDYDILNQLSSCTDENKAGPTNCVITAQFAQAINERLTVAEAINRGIIDPNKRLGFTSQGGTLSYLDGYPYRSLIILRKYRILSVGWELAAQYIKDNPSTTKDVTLGDLIDCFDPSDTTYVGLQEDWCQGLIDPNWVLKVPKQYCGMEGYGPEIIQDQIIPSGVGYCAKSAEANCDPRGKDGVDGCNTNYVTCFNDTQCGSTYAPYSECNFTIKQDHQIARNNTYCADEQSCIKENANGSCAYYGYCTEERRRWVFNQNQENSCEARNNTCQSFKNDNGQQAYFLENTLDYQNCDASQVGCKQYALTGAYDQVSKKITWDGAGPQAFFNKNAVTCDESQENCHQFIRIKDDLDTNLIADGSFENSTCISSGVISKEIKAPKKTNSILESLLPTAQAQTSIGTCDLEEFTTPYNQLAPPNDRWHIIVNRGTVKAGIVNEQANSGTQSLYIEGEGGWFSQEGGGGLTRYSSLPDTFRMEEGKYYTLSARVFVVEGTAYAGFGFSGTDHVESTVTGQWQTLRVTYYKPIGSTVSNYFVSGRNANSKFYIDDIKLTVGRAQTDYTEYGQNNVIYQKLLPNYLAATCYDAVGREPYTLKLDAPEECKKFARQCNDSEVGCEAFTALETGLSITGKVAVKDYCPQSCVGYNTFVQQPNAFNPRQAAYFIPSTAQRCSAKAVGCTAFTNLDRIDQGGEAIEYYSSMRKCIKPDPNRCLSFYTWEGSDESGYQLKVYSLQKDTSSLLGDEPLSTLSAVEEAAICNETIFRKLPTEPGYNYDCRQFYAQDGTVSYHLLEKTISCSDNCHPYRRELNTSASCTAAGGSWDGTESRCLYYAIPGEGQQCSANEVGCSEYTGNIASNTRNIFVPSVSSFENISDPLFEGWYNTGSGLSRSNASLTLGGHSLLGNSLARVVGQTVTQNKSYNITFIARSASNSPVPIGEIEFVNENNDRAFFTTTSTSIGTEWKLYSFTIDSLDHQVSSTDPDNRQVGEKIKLTFDSNVFIDNIKLTEIPNRYYLIKNSWVTPAECDQDYTGAASAGYMLGCSQYQRTDKTRVNLHSFSSLCSDTSAGCEAMIDTHNSTDYNKKLVNDTNGNGACETSEVGCIEVPADTMINVIYDPTKQCAPENKGCQRMGQGSSYNGVTSFTNVYVKNNPDVYATTVCKSSAVGCSKWTTPDGDAYFKDPGNEVCEWRLKAGTPNEYHWYQKKVQRCGGTIGGALCSSSADCTGTDTCQLEINDNDCVNTYDKTLGEGGKKVLQPANWAGICNASEVGCTELIDPTSSFNPNVISNPDFQPSSTGTGVDFWEVRNDALGGKAVQSQIFNTHTTYILKGNTGCAYNNGSGNCQTLDEVYIRDCTFTSGGGGSPVIYQLSESDNMFHALSVPYSALVSGSDRSLEFYIASSDINSTATTVSCSVWRNNTTRGKNVELRPAVVGYQLRQNLDTQSPNGLVSNSKGYVLFNQRIQAGNTKAPLIFNSDETGDGGTDGTQPKNNSHPYNANVIIKVQPDRTCSKWLDCTSYIPDPNDPRKQSCLEVGLCDSLNSEGQCDHFIDAPTNKNQNITNLVNGAQIANLTGYSKVGYYRDLSVGGLRGPYGVSTLGDYYNLATMKQTGSTVPLVNADFEFAAESTGNDNGWVRANSPETMMLLQPAQLAKESLSSNHLIKNRGGTSDSFLPPSGSGIAKIENSTPAKQKVALEAGKSYTISAYIYNQGGGEGEINLIVNGTGSPTTILTTRNDPQNRWLHKAAVFVVPTGSTYEIELTARPGGPAYFDLIAIESGLSVRCSNRDQTQDTCTTTEYTPSTCRLYPTEDALGCQSTDANNTIHKGLKGYCLEYDPNFPDTCLLWYPLDKIASDGTEEGLGLNLPSLYYCLEAESSCPSPGVVGSVPNNGWLGVTNPRAGSGSITDISSYEAYGARWYARGTPPPYTSSFPHTFTGGSLVPPNSAGGSPDKPILYCNKVAYIQGGDAAKYWRTRMISSSSYVINAGAIDFIHYPPAQGGDVTPTYKAINNFGANTSFNSNSLLKYENADDIRTSRPLATAASSNDNLTCNGLLHTYDNHDSNSCKPLEQAFLGQWEQCGCTATSSGGNDCTDVYQCRPEQRDGTSGPGWYAMTTDHSDWGGGGHADPEADFVCSSTSKVTHNTRKSINPKDELLSSIFVQTNTIYNRAISGYTPSGINVSVPNNRCGDNGTTAYTSFCTGDSSVACTSDAGCTGKGTCFMRRRSIESSGEFNYTTDYCFIPPKVYDFSVNGLKNQLVVTNGSLEVNFSFNTKTDPDQLPLKTIKIDLGYRVDVGGVPAKKEIDLGSGNYGDALRNIRTSVLSYNNIFSGPDGSSLCKGPNGTVSGRGVCGAKPCCFVQPIVQIMDNWGICNGTCPGSFKYGESINNPAGNYIRVDQN